MIPHLFVYGTLRAAMGRAQSERLKAEADWIGEARSHGLLFDLGNYPGMSASTEQGAWVRGEVYLLHDLSSSLPGLDAYEGCGPADPSPHEFERQIVTAILDNGRAVQAWAYLFNLETQGKMRIASGAYLQHRRRLAF